MTFTDRRAALLLTLFSALVVGASVLYVFLLYDAANSPLLAFTSPVGELPPGFTHFNYQPDSMVYLDIVRRMYKYGLVGYWLDPGVSGNWTLLRYYLVVVLGRPLSHVGNLVVYGIWRDPGALLILPVLAGVLSPTVSYLTVRELGFSEYRGFLAGLLLLLNKHFLFEAGQALFDVPALLLGLLAMYVWLRSKRTGEERWVASVHLIALLYRQSNVIVFLACLACDFWRGNLKGSRWYVPPLIATLVLAPLYMFHLGGVWTFFTPGLIETEYHGSLATKPTYFVASWGGAFGWMSVISVLGFVGWLVSNRRDLTKAEAVVPIYLVLAWAFSFVWAINDGRFWLIALFPVVYFTLWMLRRAHWAVALGFVLAVVAADQKYSAVAELGIRRLIGFVSGMGT
jgi:hypothetical protein